MKVAPAKTTKGHKLLKKATANAATKGASSAKVSVGPSSPFSTPAPSPASAPGTPSLKRKMPYDEEEEGMGAGMQVDTEDEDADGEMDVDQDDDSLSQSGGGKSQGLEDAVLAPPTPPSPPLLSKEQEIEKLRTSGSMTQSISEIARVKNLNRLQMGKHAVDAWYFSPYPKEYAHLPILYICEFCLSFFPSNFMLGRHRKRCNLLYPPGNEIYRHEDISFFEVDGRKQVAWCRNLSLLSKCFLDQ